MPFVRRRRYTSRPGPPPPTIRTVEACFGSVMAVLRTASRPRAPHAATSASWRPRRKASGPHTESTRGCASFLQFDGELDLDGRPEGQLCHADGAAGVLSGLTEDLAEQLAGAVDQPRLGAEGLAAR